MKLELEISGGLAAPLTSNRFDVDVASLRQEVQKQVEELVNNLLAAPPPTLNPKLRDAMSYQLTITSDALKKTVVADDGGVPQPMRELIRLIKSVGTRTKRSQ
jgi:hypothetical protein